MHADVPMTAREREAVELLDRIHNRRSGRYLTDDCMILEWVDEEIAAFIRAHGSFEDQLRG